MLLDFFLCFFKFTFGVSTTFDKNLEGFDSKYMSLKTGKNIFEKTIVSPLAERLHFEKYNKTNGGQHELFRD